MLTQDVVLALSSPIRQYITRVEWLDWNEKVVGNYTADVIDGNITADMSNDVRRSFSMTVDNASGLYVPNGARTNMGVKVRVLRGIMTSVGARYWNRGIYVLTDPEAACGGAENTVALNGVDKWSLHNGDLGGTLTETVVIANGTNVAAAIRAVAEDGGETKFFFDECPVNTPYTITKEPGDTRADLMKELALIPSWELYYDDNGYLRFKPITDPLNKQAVVDLAGSYSSMLIDSKYNPQWSAIKNLWKVIGYSDQNTGITSHGTVRDNNPVSPTNIGTPPDGIGVKAEVLVDANLTDDDLCEQRAAYELRQNLRMIDRSSHSILPLPFLLEGDCVKLANTDAGLSYGKYEIQAVTESLGLGLMQIETWKVVNIYELVHFSDFTSSLGDWQPLNDGVLDIFGVAGNNCMRVTLPSYSPYDGGVCNLDKPVVDFELAAYVMDAKGGNYPANIWVGLVNENGNGYAAGLFYDMGILVIAEMNGWSPMILAGKYCIPSPLAFEWYTVRFTRIMGQLSAEYYNGRVSDFGEPLLVATSPFGSAYSLLDRVMTTGGIVSCVDDVMVRKLL